MSFWKSKKRGLSSDLQKCIYNHSPAREGGHQPGCLLVMCQNRMLIYRNRMLVCLYRMLMYQYRILMCQNRMLVCQNRMLMCQSITWSGAAGAAVSSSTGSMCSVALSCWAYRTLPYELLLKNQPLSCYPWFFCFQMGMQGEKMNHYKSKHHETLYDIHCLYRARQNNSNKKILSSTF